MRVAWSILAIVACASPQGSPIALRASFQRGDHGEVLAIAFRHPVLARRLDGVDVHVAASCRVGGREVRDESSPLAPMLATDDNPNLVHTTDELTDELLRNQQLSPRPTACQITITVTLRDSHAAPLVLATGCLHSDGLLTIGPCTTGA